MFLLLPLRSRACPVPVHFTSNSRLSKVQLIKFNMDLHPGRHPSRRAMWRLEGERSTGDGRGHRQRSGGNEFPSAVNRVHSYGSAADKLNPAAAADWASRVTFKQASRILHCTVTRYEEILCVPVVGSAGRRRTGVCHVAWQLY